MGERPDRVCDFVVIGGGVAGLWALAELIERGRTGLLLERSALGQGQTAWSQGILHGGLKYTLRGGMTGDASAIRDMPSRWNRSLAGEESPDLSGVDVRSPSCHLWHTGSLRSRASMFGARVGLRTTTSVVDAGDRPAALEGVPGSVALVDERVIEPVSMLEAFARRYGRWMHDTGGPGVSLEGDPGAPVCCFDVDGSQVRVRPRMLVLAAGAGNEDLRDALGLEPDAMQIRPLRMVMVRGELPVLNGHCVDGMKTRATITTSQLESERVWQIGGEIAELGATLDASATIAMAKEELGVVVPGLDLSGARWSTYEAPRAEGRMANGRKPEGAVVRRDDRVITVWPSKLVLAPDAAARIGAMSEASEGPADLLDEIGPLRCPSVATPPWLEQDRSWAS